MLELTKVINELKDVLIQQVSAHPAAFFLPTTAPKRGVCATVPGERDVVSQEHHLRVPGLRYAALTAASLPDQQQLGSDQRSTVTCLPKVWVAARW